MGDGQAGEKYVKLDETCREDPHSEPYCTKITYNIGPKGWAGVYYQYPQGNWGDMPGYNIQGAKKLTFWAMGLDGDEVVGEHIVESKQLKEYFDELGLTKELLAGEPNAPESIGDTEK